MSTASGARAGEQGGVQGAAQCIQLSELGNLQHFCDNSLEISCSNIISILFLSLVGGLRRPFQSFFLTTCWSFFFLRGEHLNLNLIVLMKFLSIMQTDSVDSDFLNIHLTSGFSTVL